MTDREIVDLWGSYLQICENQQLDEISSEVRARTSHSRTQNLSTAQKAENDARDAGATMGERSKLAAKVSDAAAKVTKNKILSSAHARSRARMAAAGQNVQDSYEYDAFDAILKYLVVEGYADTEEAATAIMANMSEEWREEILDENKMDKELKTPNWDKVYDRNNRDFGPNHTSKPERRSSGKLETPNQTTKRLGKQRRQDHKDTRGVKQIPGAKGIGMQFGRAF